MKLSKLYFEYIKDKHLERKNVTAEDLAKDLAEHDFIILIGDEFDWTPKATSKEFKREFWKVIDSVKSTSDLRGRKSYRSHTILFLFCLARFGLDTLAVPGCILSAVEQKIVQPRCYTCSPTHCPVFLDLVNLPLKGSVS